MKKCICCGEKITSGYVVCEECKDTLVNANGCDAYDEDADAVIDDDSFQRGYQSALMEEAVETADDDHEDGFHEGYSYALETLYIWVKRQGSRIAKEKLLKELEERME